MVTTRCPAEEEITRLTQALVVLDVVESVRLMEADEAGFIDRWRRFVRLARHGILPLHGGRMRKSLGDGLLLEFGDVTSALHAAEALVEAALACEHPGRPDLAMRLRVGVHQAQYVADELDIYGTGVNVAARLAQAAGPGDILLTAAVRDRLPHKLRRALEDLGPCSLRHVSRPVHVFRVPAGEPVAIEAADDPEDLLLLERRPAALTTAQAACAAA